MGRPAKHKRKRKHYTLPSAGSSPGVVFLDENSLLPKIQLHSYNDQHYTINDLDNLENLPAILSNKKLYYWIEIRGLGSIEMFDILNIDFGISKLVLEDITRTYQRPKFEEYGRYDFAVSRMLRFDEQKNLDNDQVSFILLENALFTFQEGYDDCLTPVRTRLKVGKGNIRIAGSSYLMYALMDIMIDTYFEILGKWGDELDLIEDRLFDKPDKTVMFDTQIVKRNLINVRRVMWPERDKLNDMLRTDSLLIPDHTKMYIRDAYDHCIQVIDIVESMKEISASNIDMYLSIISNRMNEIMKVLTIISSIFIPLTFIAGIYGMNFAFEDPITGKLLPKNMPELYHENGYLYAIIVMGFIAVLQIIYFWRKGWFK